MFRSTPDIEQPAREMDTPIEPIALSVLALDLDVPPGGWPGFLAARDIEILIDDLGREAITRVDARRLFDEKRENEARAAQARAAAEQRAVEADQQWRSQLFHGISADLIPAELTPAAAMLTPRVLLVRVG